MSPPPSFVPGQLILGHSPSSPNGHAHLSSSSPSLDLSSEHHINMDDDGDDEDDMVRMEEEEEEEEMEASPTLVRKPPSLVSPTAQKTPEFEHGNPEISAV